MNLIVLFAIAALSLVNLATTAFAYQKDGAQQAKPALDFETYRDHIEPVFLRTREGAVRCYDCHSVVATRLRLQPLLPGMQSWTPEQSRLNFEIVSNLITPGDPEKSRLLLHPLLPEEGGDPTHTGGKFWKSKNDPEWRMLADWVRVASPVPQVAANPGAVEAEINYFKTMVEPIFLKERPGHARCYGCHVLGGRAFHLEPLSAGSANWSDEQSRRNFQNARGQITPGDPTSSRLLMHPLAPEAGGEEFHSGGRQFASQNDPDWLAIARWVRDAGPPVPGASVDDVTRIYVTNSAGDTIDVVDSHSNKVVQVIRGIELPHGITFSPDGNRVYISNESENVLDVVDRKSGNILQKISLSGHPNNIAITKDGGRVLVGIRADPGAVDVIDTKLLRRTTSIPVYGSVHNVFVTPDGKCAVSGSIENKTATVIDLETEKAVWRVQFNAGVRPMAFDTNPDGSTARMFVQLSRLNGFAVVDFVKRAEIARIEFPDQPTGFGAAEGRLETPAHGIGVAPDGKSLWVNSTMANAVFKYSLPELDLIGHTELPLVHRLGHSPSGSVPEWITFVPDSKSVYVSNSGAASVSVIDSVTMKVVALIPVGEVPKRINALTIHGASQ
jgi:YVTN family beta-propeller protein